MSKLHRQNKDQVEAVPGTAISRMMDRWEVPTAIEADAVELWIDGDRIRFVLGASTAASI